MPSPISRRPAGLLDLLLTQQQGRNPRELLDSVQPVIDLATFYAQERLAIAQADRSSSTVNQTQTIEIPAGESWLVYSVGNRVTFNAVSQVIVFNINIEVHGSDTGTLAMDRFTASAAGANDRFSNAHFLYGIVFPPGTQFTQQVGEIDLAAGGNISHWLNIMYSRMTS